MLFSVYQLAASAFWCWAATCYLTGSFEFRVALSTEGKALQK